MKTKKLSIALAGIMSAAAIASAVPMGTGATFGSVATVAHAETTTVTWSSSAGNLNTGGVSVDTDYGYDGYEWKFAYYDESGTFTTSLGNFTKIEIAGGYIDGFGGTGWNGTGWSGRTWTGNDSRVFFEGYLTDNYGNDPFTITFTIESEDPATATYTQVGSDYTSETEFDNAASLWNVTVTAGDESIEKIDVKLGAITSEEGEQTLDTPIVTDAEIVLGVITNLSGAEVNNMGGFTVMVNGKAL